MRELERDDRITDPALRHHGLDPELRGALLPPALAERRTRALAAVERPYPGGVPRAALVVADAAASGLEHGVPGGVERLLGNEPDELDASAHAEIISGELEDLELVALRVEEVCGGAPLGAMDRLDLHSRRLQPLDCHLDVVDPKRDDGGVSPRKRKAAR